MTWIYMYYLTLGWLFMSYLYMYIFSAATFWHIEHRGLFSLNYWLVDVESTKGSCCIKKKVSHLTFLNRKVQCQGHISLLFFDDCCWYSLTAVQRLQWSKADTGAWILVPLLGEQAANSLCCPAVHSQKMLWLSGRGICTQYAVVSVLEDECLCKYAVWRHTLLSWDFTITETK